ncbi:substrate-binding domain-containing protein [Epibacterium ulvae]|uniref:substrate-binding domain-containing protein n=1 Tax=Epibacterium ulvae TaxID=1156985 RepID=UPI001BFC6AF2|nr:substrate-binding domain-containing protein [Epibacterium ulvae]MBT8154088.1 substrate-binding domain-containing protein [Epibacterium ulvae]
MTNSNTINSIRAGLLGSALACAGMVTTAAAEEPIFMDQGADIASMCGDKPMRVALIDGFGGDTWRKITRAEFEDELSKCDNVTEVRYVDANGDQQKYNGDINSLIAQGMDVIVAFTDFGDAALQTYRKAHRDGVTIVPYFSNISGEAGTDYAANLYQDQYYVGGLWADWMGKTLNGEGNVVVLGGVAGAASSQVFLDGFKAGIADYPGIKLLDENFIVTNWNPADAQRAVTGLIAQYPEIDGIASDYGVTTLAAIKAFEQAGLDVPAQATLASNNEINCKYVEAKAAGTVWEYFSLDGTVRTVRFAARAGVAAFQGTENSDPTSVVPFVYADSAAGIDPLCDPAAPPDADLSSGLPADKLSALFQ